MKLKQQDYSPGVETAIKLGLKAMGHSVETVETLWRDPSAIYGPNVAASMLPLQAIGVPQDVLFEMLGAGPSSASTGTSSEKKKAGRVVENYPNASRMH